MLHVAGQLLHRRPRRLRHRPQRREHRELREVALHLLDQRVRRGHRLLHIQRERLQPRLGGTVEHVELLPPRQGIGALMGGHLLRALDHVCQDAHILAPLDDDRGFQHLADLVMDLGDEVVQFIELPDGAPRHRGTVDRPQVVEAVPHRRHEPVGVLVARSGARRVEGAVVERRLDALLGHFLAVAMAAAPVAFDVVLQGIALHVPRGVQLQVAHQARPDHLGAHLAPVHLVVQLHQNVAERGGMAEHHVHLLLPVAPFPEAAQGVADLLARIAGQRDGQRSAVREPASIRRQHARVDARVELHQPKRGVVDLADVAIEPMPPLVARPVPQVLERRVGVVLPQPVVVVGARPVPGVCLLALAVPRPAEGVDGRGDGGEQLPGNVHYAAHRFRAKPNRRAMCEDAGCR